MSNHNTLYWQHIGDLCPPLPDPRIYVTRHMAWQMPSDISLYVGVEPDNYNFCIFDDKPYDLKFIQHQCWYKVDYMFRRKRINGWFSLYVAEERLQSILFNREILKIQPQGVWRYPRAKPIRTKRTELQREKFHPKNKIGQLTTEERLYQQGYYESLKNKYFDNERFLKVVGQPRGCVQTPEPEALDCDGL